MGRVKVSTWFNATPSGLELPLDPLEVVGEMVTEDNGANCSCDVIVVAAQPPDVVGPHPIVIAGAATPIGTLIPAIQMSRSPGLMRQLAVPQYSENSH